MHDIRIPIRASGHPRTTGHNGTEAGAAGRIRIRLVPGPVTVSGGSAQARFTATADLASGHVWPRPAASRLVIGYRGGLAFAVLVEGGGTGADSAGPIANAFLREL